jgi:hypothetical protein
LFQENPECRKHFSDNTFLKGATLEEGGVILNPQPLTQPLADRLGQLNSRPTLSPTDSTSTKEAATEKIALTTSNRNTAATDNKEPAGNIAVLNSNNNVASRVQMPSGQASTWLSHPTNHVATLITAGRTTNLEAVPGRQTFPKKDVARTDYYSAVNSSSLRILLSGKMAPADHVTSADPLAPSGNMTWSADHVASADHHVVSADNVASADPQAPSGHMPSASHHVVTAADHVVSDDDVASADPQAPSGHMPSASHHVVTAADHVASADHAASADQQPTSSIRQMRVKKMA